MEFAFHSELWRGLLAADPLTGREGDTARRADRRSAQEATVKNPSRTKLLLVKIKSSLRKGGVFFSLSLFLVEKARVVRRATGLVIEEALLGRLNPVQIAYGRP